MTDAPELSDAGFARRVNNELDALGYPETHQLRREALLRTTRSDHALALVAAAYEAAAGRCDEEFAKHMDLAVCGELDNTRTRESAASMAERLMYQARALAGGE